MTKEQLNEFINIINEALKEDMTDEELAILQKQFKEFAYERLANRNRD
jgi:hypothetical protein